MAKVTITLEIDEAVVDTAVANMPDEALEMAIDAIAAAYGWTEFVANPNFDSSQPDGEDNPRTIPNMSKARHFSYQLRKFAEEHTLAYAKKQAEVAAAQAAANAVSALSSQITVE